VAHGGRSKASHALVHNAMMSGEARVVVKVAGVRSREDRRRRAGAGIPEHSLGTSLPPACPERWRADPDARSEIGLAPLPVSPSTRRN
jgi:hypothetical protein